MQFDWPIESTDDKAGSRETEMQRRNQAKKEAHAAAAHKRHSETNRETIEIVYANRVAITHNSRARYSAIQSQVLSNSRARYSAIVEPGRSSKRKQLHLPLGMRLAQ